jgi:protein ImuB
MDAGRPAELRGEAGRHALVAAEGPERLSGDWWTDPYHREYFRVCTQEGGLIWLFREYRPSGELRWWLHGWWD